MSFCLIGLRPNPLSLEIARISFGSLLAYSRFWRCKGTATFAWFQKFRRNFPGVVATGHYRCDKGRPKAKRLSWTNKYSQLFCGIKRNCVKSCKMFASVESFSYFCRWVRDENGLKSPQQSWEYVYTSIHSKLWGYQPDSGDLRSDRTLCHPFGTRGRITPS